MEAHLRVDPALRKNIPQVHDLLEKFADAINESYRGNFQSCVS